MTVDYEKIKRQLKASPKVSNMLRQGMLKSIHSVYHELETGKIENAREDLRMFDNFAKALKWPGGGAALPRPFNHRHLEELYWQAQRLANGVEVRPRRTGSGMPTKFHELGR